VAETLKHKLTPKRLRFVEAFCGRAQGNASEAARIAGYKDPGQEGWRLLQNVGIQAAVEKRIARALKRLSVDSIVQRLEDHIETDMAAYIEQVDKCEHCGRYAPRFDLDALKEAGLGHLLQEIRLNQKTGEVTIKLQSVQRAADMVLKVAGAYQRDDADGKGDNSLAMALAHALQSEQRRETEETKH